MGQTTAEELPLGKVAALPLLCKVKGFLTPFHQCSAALGSRWGCNFAQGEREYQHLQQLLGSSEKELVEELRQACPELLCFREGALFKRGVPSMMKNLMVSDLLPLPLVAK